MMMKTLIKNFLMIDDDFHNKEIHRYRTNGSQTVLLPRNAKEMCDEFPSMLQEKQIGDDTKGFCGFYNVLPYENIYIRYKCIIPTHH